MINYNSLSPPPQMIYPTRQQTEWQFVDKLKVNCLGLLAGTGPCCQPQYRPAVWSPCINPCQPPPVATNGNVVLTLCPPKNCCATKCCGNSCESTGETYAWKTLDNSAITSKDGYRMEITSTGIKVYGPVPAPNTLLYTLPVTAPNDGDILKAGPLGVVTWQAP